MIRTRLSEATTFVLVRPHYPENVGAAARAMKTMGLTRLCLVKPGKLAVPEHEMAYKMGVRAWDVLAMARRLTSLSEALVGFDLVLCTTAKTAAGCVSLREAALRAAQVADSAGIVAVVFGNEKTGLAEEDLALGQLLVHIPMAAPQPSINLAQAVQLFAYEFFLAGTTPISSHDQD